MDAAELRWQQDTQGRTHLCVSGHWTLATRKPDLVLEIKVERHLFDSVAPRPVFSSDSRAVPPNPKSPQHPQPVPAAPAL